MADYDREDNEARISEGGRFHDPRQATGIGLNTTFREEGAMKSSGVSTALVFLEESMERLDKVIHVLSESLQPIYHNRDTERGGEKSAGYVDKGDSQVVIRLEELTRRVQAMAMNIQDINARVDL